MPEQTPAQHFATIRTHLWLTAAPENLLLFLNLRHQRVVPLGPHFADDLSA